MARGDVLDEQCKHETISSLFSTLFSYLPTLQHIIILDQNFLGYSHALVSIAEPPLGPPTYRQSFRRGGLRALRESPIQFVHRQHNPVDRHSKTSADTRPSKLAYGASCERIIQWRTTHVANRSRCNKVNYSHRSRPLLNIIQAERDGGV